MKSKNIFSDAVFGDKKKKKNGLKAIFIDKWIISPMDGNKPYTRVIEHKHFEMFGQEVYDSPNTVVSEEYSTEYKDGMEPYYPVNDVRNNELAEKYRSLAEDEKNVIFGGRLGQYKYYDMAPVIEQVLNMEIN